MKDTHYYVYIMANRRRGTLYTGSTSDLLRRVYEHKNDFADGFTKKYGVHLLVYYEDAGTSAAALTRERQIKAWKRDWKIRLIEEHNPDWKDLYSGLA